MLAMMPDYIPPSQIGIANGSLALMLALGSVSGFWCFRTILNRSIPAMYTMYLLIGVTTTCITIISVVGRGRQLKEEHMKIHNRLISGENHNENIEEPIEVDENEDISFKWYNLPNVLFYEPILKKSRSEILAGYWIDISEYYDFFVVSMSRFFLLHGDQHADVLSLLRS